MGKKGTPRRKWSAEDKVRIGTRHLEERVSLRQLEAEAGNALIGSWVKRYMAEGTSGLEARNGNPYATTVDWILSDRKYRYRKPSIEHVKDENLVHGRRNAQIVVSDMTCFLHCGRCYEWRWFWIPSPPY